MAEFHPCVRPVLQAVLVGVGLIATPALAAHGTLSLSWDTCSPVVANLESPVAGPVSLVASVTGNDQTHSGYFIRFFVHGVGGPLPDAWRFDLAGCQTGGQFLQ